MKVFLIQPPSCDPLTDQIFLFEPLALEYLGAGLKKDGHDVLLLDARIEPDYENTCRRFQPDVVRGKFHSRSGRTIRHGQRR